MYEYENQNQNWNVGQPVQTPEPQKPNKQKKPHNFARGIGKAIAFGLVFGLVAGCTFQGVNFAANKALGTQTAQVQESQDATEQEDTTPTVGSTTDSKPAISQATVTAADDGTYTVSDIAQMCMPSVVAITDKGVTEVQSWFGTMQQESESAGSGIIVGQNDEELLIATNNHVVSGAEELSVCFNDDVDQVYEAHTKGTDASNDLAIVAIKLSDIPQDVLSTIKIAEFGNSDELTVGEQVVAIGNALGYGQSVTSGYISALDREVQMDNMTANLIQTDAAINPGNSGGALFNMKGQVIGINSAKLAETKVEGMGYAIPISTAIPILNELENRVTREKVDASEEGYLGISCQDVSSDAQAYGIPAGVYVAEATEGGAAQKAGIRQGDIITKFDGQTVTSVSEIKSLLQYYKAGETVDVVVERMSNEGYAEVTLSVTLDLNEQAAQSAQSGQSSDQNSQSQEEQQYSNPFAPFMQGNDR